MRPRNRVSSAGLDLVKRFEGYRRQAAQLPDGRWTIGYGHMLTAREGAIVSEPDAESLLLYDLHAAGKAVDELVFTPLTQNQFDALCSFAFNLGVDEFRRSDVLKRLNEGAMVQAACAMEMWRKAEFEGEEIVVDALVRRRAAEKVLFLTPPDDAFVPAPTPVLRPLIDPSADDLVPGEAPTELATTLYGASIVVTRGGRPLAEPEPVRQLEPDREPEPEPAPDPEWLASPQDEPAPEEEPAPDETSAAEPGDRIAAAAEAVTARLETLFADETPVDLDVEPGLEPGLDLDAVADEEPVAPPFEEPVEARDAEEEAFFEAFIETPEAEEGIQAFEVDSAEPEPSPITPIVMDYPATAAPGASMLQPSFTVQPSATPTTEPETGEFELEPDAEEVVAEPVDEDEQVSSFEDADADLWGDDESFLEPPPGSPAVAPDEPEEALELPPTAEVPPPARPDEAYSYGASPMPPEPPPEPARPNFTIESSAVREFLPQRTPRQDRPREPGLLTDLFLALLGIAFFGFAVFWGLNADPAASGLHPSVIAWGAGLLGTAFAVIAIYRLMERLGDSADRD